jgi:hypothetical protein
MKSASTPIPPNHWVRPRQKNRPLEYRPKSVRMVAPVVVNPLIDSKSASNGPTPAQR